MKKICVILLVVLLMCSVSVPVFAADEYANADALYQAWYGNLPDYITGVWSTDGSQYNLTFGIRADADVKAVKKEILALVKDDKSVSFAVQKYSYNELKAINDELLAAVGKLTAEFGRIGNNLNQIARRLNEWQAPYPALAKELRDAAVDLASLKFDVMKKVGDTLGNVQTYKL